MSKAVDALKKIGPLGALIAAFFLAGFFLSQCGAKKELAGMEKLYTASLEGFDKEAARRELAQTEGTKKIEESTKTVNELLTPIPNKKKEIAEIKEKIKNNPPPPREVKDISNIEQEYTRLYDDYERQGIIIAKQDVQLNLFSQAIDEMQKRNTLQENRYQECRGQVETLNSKIKVMDNVVRELRRKSKPPLFAIVVGGYFDPGKMTFGAGVMVGLNLTGLIKLVF